MQTTIQQLETQAALLNVPVYKILDSIVIQELKKKRKFFNSKKK